MSTIIYNVHSFSTSNAAYVDPDGASNHCVLDTIDRLHRENGYTYWSGETAFKRRQAVYEELLSKKHGDGEPKVTLLERSDANYSYHLKETEVYQVYFSDGFILVKEVVTEYYSDDRMNTIITYSIPGEGWCTDDPLNRVDYIGWITKYGKRV